MLSKFSVKKPFTVVVAIIIVLILGVVSFSNMSIDLLPNMNMPYAVVMTTYPGATAEEIEKVITAPVEESMASIGNVKSQQSMSNDNYSMVVMEFNQDANMDSAMVEMSSVLQQLSQMLPDGAGSPTTMKINPSMLPTMLFSVSVEGMDRRAASEYIDRKIIPQFESVPGVASISSTGLLTNMVDVTISEEKLEALQKKLENNVAAQVDKAVAEGNQKFTEMQNQVMGLSKTAYETSAKAEVAKAKISSVSGKVLLSEVRLLLNERIEELKGQIKDNIDNGTVGIPQSTIDLLEELEKLQSAIENNDFSALGSILSSIIEKSDPTTIIGDISASFEDYLQNIVPNLDLKKEISDIMKIAQVNVGKSPEVGAATAEYAKIYGEYIAKSEAASTAKMTMLIAAANAKEQAEGGKGDFTGVEITKEMIGQIISAQSFDMPAGSIAENNDTYVVRTGDKINTYEELESLPLINIPTIGTVKLSDIATVTKLDNSEKMYAKVNGENAIVLSISKQPEYSTADVSKSIYGRMDQLKKETETLSFSVIMDQGEYVDVMINTIIQNLIIGGILAIIILFIFLKSVKPTIIVGISILICMIATFVLMYFMGISLNIISMSGIALAIGMLVDNSIVVIENIFRLRNMGVPVKEAAIKGAKEMSGAIVASTLTTIVVFVPIVFTKGLTRQLFTDMALTIGFALLCSLVVALTLVPAAAGGMMKKAPNVEVKWFDKITRGYVRLLDKTLRHKWITISLVVVLLGVSIVAAMSSGTELFPQSDGGSISITVDLPIDYTDQERTKALDNLYKTIKDTEYIETIGIINSGNTQASPMGGGTTVYANLSDKRDKSTDEVADSIRKSTEKLDFPVSVGSSSMDMSAISGGSVVVEIRGKELDNLRSAALDIEKLISETDGTTEIDNGLGKQTNELRITVDKQKAADNNLTVAAIYMEVAKKLKATTATTTISDGDMSYDVYVYDQRNTDIKTSDVGNMELTLKDGRKIKISDIAEIGKSQGLSTINRSDGERVIKVSASLQNGYNVGKVNAEIQKKLNDYEAPGGCIIKLAGENESIKNSFNDLYLMLALAIVFIYLVMVAQFQSLLSPFVVMFTIPLAFTGGFLALFLCQIPISIISLIGLVVLVGVVVNNGIVYVSCVNELHNEQGVPVHEALLKTASMRIRPIVMTSLTTIIALLVSAFDPSAGAAMLRPVSVTVIGGMLYATVLTMFFVPAMYAIFNKDKKKCEEVQGE